MAPSLALEERPHLGPVACEPLALDDPWLAALLAKAETSFLASVSPDGGPDVAHRGGPPGFLELDAAARRLTWPEYVGDGVFKSAGNVRATGIMTLLVPDHDSGDGVELIGRGDYRNIRPERRQRIDALVQHREPVPNPGGDHLRHHQGRAPAPAPPPATADREGDQGHLSLNGRRAGPTVGLSGSPAVTSGRGRRRPSGPGCGPGLSCRQPPASAAPWSAARRR